MPWLRQLSARRGAQCYERNRFCYCRSSPIIYGQQCSYEFCVSKRSRKDEALIEIRDLWLQREVGLGKVVVNKVAGPRNPADLMTNCFKEWEID